MFIDKLIGDKRRYRQYKKRAHELPADYRGAVEALERYLLCFGPGSGQSIAQMLDDLVELFEQNTENHMPLPEVIGEDPVQFAEDFLANYTDNGWVAKERQRLVHAIDEAAATRGN